VATGLVTVGVVAAGVEVDTAPVGLGVVVGMGVVVGVGVGVGVGVVAVGVVVVWVVVGGVVAVGVVGVGVVWVVVGCPICMVMGVPPGACIGTVVGALYMNL